MAAKLVRTIVVTLCLIGSAGCYPVATTDPERATQVSPVPGTGVPTSSPLQTPTAGDAMATEQAPEATGSPVVPLTSVPATPAPSPNISEPAGQAQPYDPAMEPVVRAAVEDLAQRLGVPASTIEVMEAEAVVWSDNSLGCPRPGMRYPQVPVDGARIVLRAVGKTYAYHSGGSRPPFLCTPAPPTKGGGPKIDPIIPTPGSADT